MERKKGGGKQEGLERGWWYSSRARGREVCGGDQTVPGPYLGPAYAYILVYTCVPVMPIWGN